MDFGVSTCVRRVGTGSVTCRFCGWRGGVENDKGQDSVRAVDRALEILSAWRPGDEGLTVAELLKRVNLSRPTLYRLLATLEQNHFLVSSGDPQRFRLGSSVARLAHVWRASLSIHTIAEPMLTRLWEATGETVALFVPEGVYRLCVEELPSVQPLSFKRGVGYRERLVLGASGRCILANMPLSADALATYAAGIDMDLATYPAALDEVRERGYAMSRDELITGAVAVAAPFFDGSDRVAGSICIFGPGVRLDADDVARFGALLVAEAAVLSRELGQRPTGR